jgi:biotin carboxylase
VEFRCAAVESMEVSETVLVLGGSRWQLGIIRAVKRLGLKAIVADISPEAPGRAIADEFVQIDTNDRVGLCDIARSRGAALVLAEQTDRLVPVAGYINDELGLPGIRADVASRFTNKLTMRTQLEPADVPMPRYRAVSSASAAVDAAAWTGLPAIVKPLRAQSSIGVTLVSEPDQVAAAYETARGVGVGDQVLIEEFVDGLEVTVEAISIDGTCTVLAMSEKAHYTHRPCVARLLAYPPRLANDVIGRLRATAKRVVEYLGLENGLSHAEYRIRSGIPYLVEVAARGGGSGIASLIVPHVSGLDTYGLVIRRLLGGKVTLPAPSEKAAILEFFDFAPGKVSAVEGIAECLDAGLAKELEVPYSAGDVVHPATDDRNRPGYFIALGDDRDDVDARAKAIKARVRLHYVGERPS